MSKGPVLFDLDEQDAPLPAVDKAHPVPDLEVPGAQGSAMHRVVDIAAARPSRLARWFWTLLLAVISAAISIAAWDFVNGLIARNTYLGWAFAGLIGLFLLVCLIMCLREAAAIGRLKRVDGLRHAAAQARAEGDLKQARRVSKQLLNLYGRREDTRWGRDRLAELSADQLDATALLDLSERELLASLDEAATREVEKAARQVATVTALVPLALADVATALTANLRMIRRIAEIYGGRSGVIGGWRLTRAVMAHLVATGAVAVGDDLLEPILGGSILGKLSRRFGEGLVNGALTARVGAAAMDVCRPLEFHARQRPKSREIIRRALVGFIPGRT